MNSEILNLFNEKAELIVNSRFALNVLQKDINCSMSWEAGSGLEITSPDYDQTELHAFILTIRLFLQNNDAISIKKLHDYYLASSHPQDLKDAVTEERKRLNDYLDSTMIFRWPDGAETYREHLDTILYGDLSHLNGSKQALFKRWLQDPLISHHMWTLFFMTLQQLMSSISYFRVINIEAMKELEG